MLFFKEYFVVKFTLELSVLYKSDSQELYAFCSYSELDFLFYYSLMDFGLAIWKHCCFLWVYFAAYYFPEGTVSISFFVNSVRQSKYTILTSVNGNILT